MAQQPQQNGGAPANPASESQSDTEDRPVFRKALALGILALVLIAAAVVGILYYLHARQFETTDDAFIDGNIVAVSPKIAGRISEVLVQDNQEVAAGELLAKIDPKDLAARVNQAEATYDAALARLNVARTNVELTRANTAAALNDATAQVEQARASVTASQAQLASAQADVTAAQADNTRREQDLRRYESLDPRVVTQQQLDTARAAAETSRATLDAARKRVAAAESAIIEAQAKVKQRQATLAAAQTAPQQIASAESQVQNAQAAVQEAKAALDAARLDLSYTSVFAPVAGRVARKSVQPGQYTQIGQSMLALVQSEVWVTANFKETQLTRMRAGQEVEISVDAYPGKTFSGKVQSIQGGTGARFSLLPPENATGNYVKVVQRVPVKIVFDNGSDLSYLLAPGMSVEPRVTVGTDKNLHPAPIRPPTTRVAAASH
jgi:membrane fusion protein (multidrug efflux system)